MKKKMWIVLPPLLLLVLAALHIGVGHYVRELRQQQYLAAHVFVGGDAYPVDAEYLSLEERDISIEYYCALREALPNCTIVWDVPFQERSYPCGTEHITVSSLTMADIETLDYLPALKTVDARQCRDYAALAALELRRPGVKLDYPVVLGGAPFERDVTELSFPGADAAELLENLRYLPCVRSVELSGDTMAAEELRALADAYPDITFSWEKTVLGQSFPNTVTELDFSGTSLTGIEELEADMAYFPELQKLILCDCGIDNETMAAFRDRARETYKVVWRVNLGRIDIRTDKTTFMPRKVNVNVTNSELDNLKYCEDMIVVDVGHMVMVEDLEWLYGMPHLQFLILADTGVSDLTPIGSLKELIYLELFKSGGIRDYSPLVGCTALQDLNVAFTHGDAKVFADMPWLKNLWVNQTGVDTRTRSLLKEKLPDTVIEFDHGWHMGNGWRDLDNYYIMRDLLEMPYYNWGSTKHEIGGSGKKDEP